MYSFILKLFTLLLYQFSTQEQRTQRQPSLIGHKIMYIIGVSNNVLHFIVGIVWENVYLPQQKPVLLKFPYFGGYIILVAIALLLLFLYMILSLNREPEVPLNLRRFYLTMSVIAAVASFTLVIIMCIHANDYRQSQEQMAEKAYYGAVFMTIIDIILTIISMPAYIYLVFSNFIKMKGLADKGNDILGPQQTQQNQGNGVSDRVFIKAEQLPKPKIEGESSTEGEGPKQQQLPRIQRYLSSSQQQVAPIQDKPIQQKL